VTATMTEAVVLAARRRQEDWVVGGLDALFVR
jgi:hypothetical protein